MPFIPDNQNQSSGFIPESQTQQTQEPQKQSWLNSIGSIAGLDVLGKTIAGGIVKGGKAIGIIPQPKVVAPQGVDQTQFQNQFNQEQQNAISADMPTFGQNVGAGIKLAATIVPVGKLVTGGLALKGAIAGGSYGLGQSMVDKKNLGETALTTGEYALGGALISKLGGYIFSRVPKLLGIVSGENSGTIKYALENPSVADQGIQNGDEALRKVVQEGADASVKLRTEFIKGEQAAIANIAKQASQKGVFYSKKITQEAFNQVLNENDIGITQKGLDFTQSKVQANPGEMGKIKGANDIIKNWKDWSLEGVHKLKQLIGGLTKFPAEGGGTSKSPVLGKVYHTIDTMIKEGLPAAGKKLYTAVNDKFSQNIEMFNEVVDAFNKGEPFTKLANALGDNKDSLRLILDFYEKQTGNKVLPVVAGRELAQEKAAAFGILNPRSWIDFFYSPPAQGKTITTIGKAESALKSFMPKQTGQFLNQQTLNTFLRNPNANK